MNRDSGRYKGQRKTQGGRPQVRTVLYMAMMSAM
jgi:transposase